MARRRASGGCSSSSTTRKAARARCCTAIRRRNGSSPRSSAPMPIPRAISAWNRSTNTAPGPVSGACCASSSAAACRSRYSASPWRSSEIRTSRRHLPSWAMKWRATDGAGSTTRTSTRPPSASTCGSVSNRCAASPAKRRSGGIPGRDSPNTRRLVVEHGGFLYDSDHYGDDLPFWDRGRDLGRCRPCAPSSSPTRSTPTTCGSPPLRASIPAISFSPICATRSMCSTSRGVDRPKMLSIGMHCRLLGRPGRFAALRRFLDHVEGHDRVWVCRRADIARHWIGRHPSTKTAGARS